MEASSSWQRFTKTLESLGMQTGYFQTFPEKHFPEVLRGVRTIARRDARAAENVAYCWSTLLHKGVTGHHAQIARIIERIARTDPYESFIVANNWSNEREEISKIGPQYIPLVLDAVERILPYSIEAAARLLRGQYTRLEKVVAAGDEYVKPYFEKTVELAKHDPIASERFWEEAPNFMREGDSTDYELLVKTLRPLSGPGGRIRPQIIRASADTLKEKGRLCTKALLESIATLQDQDPDRLDPFLEAYRIISSRYTPRARSPPSDPDLFLIEHIHDQHSAHTVGQVIDKTKYGKQYAEKCGGFY